MSLASQQSSWSASVPPVVGSYKSLTVNGVPITGLQANGTLLTQASGTVGVSRILPGGTFSTRGDLVIIRNSGTGAVEFTDLVEASPDDGAFEYTFPVPLRDPPSVVCSPLLGVEPIVEATNKTSTSGVVRFPSSGTNHGGARAPNTSNFLISCVGFEENNAITLKKVIPTANGPNPLALSPSIEYTFNGPAGFQGFRYIFPVSFQTPADVNPALIAELTMSWANLAGFVNNFHPVVNSYDIAAYLLNTQNTTLGSGSQLGYWTVDGAGSGATEFGPFTTGGQFGNTNANAYQTFGVVGLQPNATFYIAFDFTNVSADPKPNLQYAIDFKQLTYYSTIIGSARSVRPVGRALAPKGSGIKWN